MIGLTLEAGHAVQGELLSGDRVDLVATELTEDGTTTERLAEAVLVVSAGSGDGGFGGDDVRLVLAVDADQAVAIIGAARRGELDLVRLGR